MRFRKGLVSVEVSLEDRVVYLAGSSYDGESASVGGGSGSDDLAARGALLRGKVSLRVNSTCSFRHLRVVLVGTLRMPAISKEGLDDQDLAARRHDNLRHEVHVLDGRSPHLSDGIHIIPFAVLLPSDLQPSFRCPYGRQEYRVYAYAEEVSGKVKMSKGQYVTLLSSGDVIDSGRPLLDLVTYHNFLGYISATMHCEIPSVGAQAFLQLELPAPQSNISIVGITVTLVQTVRVYVDTSAPAVRTEEKQLARFINAATFGTMDSITGKVAYGPRWRPGEPVSLAQSIILPTHETFAPSSNASKAIDETEAKLRMTVSHHVLIKVRYKTATQALKEVTITSRNIFLLSCKCLPNSLVLPPYSPETPLAEEDKEGRLDWFGIGRRRTTAAKGNEECNCFVPRDITQPNSSEKACSVTMVALKV